MEAAASFVFVYLQIVSSVQCHLPRSAVAGRGRYTSVPRSRTDGWTRWDFSVNIQLGTRAAFFALSLRTCIVPSDTFIKFVWTAFSLWLLKDTSSKGQDMPHICQIYHRFRQSVNINTFVLQSLTCPFENYLKEMSNPSEWGGLIEISAMSHLYR